MEASFQGQGTGHPNGDVGRPACGGDGEEVAGVERGLDAFDENEIVGGGFAFGEETTPGEPGEGLPPEGREGHAGEELEGEIVALDMGEFVEDDVIAAVGRPGIGVGGEENNGAEEAKGQGHGAGGGLEDERVMRKHGAGAAETGEGEEGVGQMGQHQGGAEGPELG